MELLKKKFLVRKKTWGIKHNKHSGKELFIPNQFNHLVGSGPRAHDSRLCSPFQCTAVVQNH